MANREGLNSDLVEVAMDELAVHQELWKAAMA
jgi:hypothetical protein